MNTATLNPTRDTVRLDRETVTQAILTAESETKAVELIFRMVYPQFDEIKSVDGYPKCNANTWKAICRPMQELTERLNKDRRYDRQVMPGGAWLNYGFSAQQANEQQLKDWEVLPAPFTV